MKVVILILDDEDESLFESASDVEEPLQGVSYEEAREAVDRMMAGA